MPPRRRRAFPGRKRETSIRALPIPTVTAFEERLAALEGAEACVATSSGMSAILSCVMGLLSAGDHIVASRSLFGATVNLFNNILKRFNIETTFVSATDVASMGGGGKTQHETAVYRNAIKSAHRNIRHRRACGRGEKSTVHGLRSITASARRHCNGRWIWAPIL